MNLQIGYDKENSTELYLMYFVFNNTEIIYKGKYIQCLAVVGAFNLDPNTTLEEIRDKSNGFI